MRATFLPPAQAIRSFAADAIQGKAKHRDIHPQRKPLRAFRMREDKTTICLSRSKKARPRLRKANPARVFPFPVQRPQSPLETMRQASRIADTALQAEKAADAALRQYPKKQGESA